MPYSETGAPEEVLKAAKEFEEQKKSAPTLESSASRIEHRKVLKGKNIVFANQYITRGVNKGGGLFVDGERVQPPAEVKLEPPQPTIDQTFTRESPEPPKRFKPDQREEAAEAIRQEYINKTERIILPLYADSPTAAEHIRNKLKSSTDPKEFLDSVMHSIASVKNYYPDHPTEAPRYMLSALNSTFEVPNELLNAERRYSTEEALGQSLKEALAQELAQGYQRAGSSLSTDTKFEHLSVEQTVKLYDTVSRINAGRQKEITLISKNLANQRAQFRLDTALGNKPGTSLENAPLPIDAPDLERDKELLRLAFPAKANVDMERINNFLVRRGLQPTEVLFYEPKDSRRLKKILGRHNPAEEESTGGQYMPEYQISFVDRTLDSRRRLRGSALTESAFVHETAHANEKSSISKVNARGETELTAPSGFQEYEREGDPYSKQKGWFFEEGWAYMIQGEYTAEMMTEDKLQELAEAMDTDEPITPNKVVDELYVPVKYLIIEEGVVARSESSRAGFAMELMCKKIPGFREKLVALRKHPKPLPEIKKILESAAPGLYEQLYHLEYDGEDFKRGLFLIIETLYKGINNWNDLMESK